MSWLKSLKNQWSSIQTLFKRSQLDDQTIEDLEDLLIQADVGLQTTTWLLEELKEEKKGLKDKSFSIQQILAQKVAERLKPYESGFPFPLPHTPYVVMMVGVNGSGKTTACAKVAHLMQQRGLKVEMVAADLFRAAATEQLVAWGERLKIRVHTAVETQKDASGLVYQAYMHAQENKVDVLILDTAGRLHHRADLMAELAKIQRVLSKHHPQAPHATLFVLDGTSGQNGFNQLKTFQETLPIHGLIITKLDGTAKGGMILNLTQAFKIPLYGLSLGEHPEDWESFSAQTFAFSLMGLNEPNSDGALR